ncbi:hypothetical protein BH10BAC5_BH10BAC5_16460 [soil metagenome]
MKKILILFCFFVSSNLFAQSFQWQRLSNAPFVSSRYEDMIFINSNTGWGLHAGYPFLAKTTNAGATFDSIPLNSLPIGVRSIGFLDLNIGIIGTLDTSHILYRTTNGGYNFSEVIYSLPEFKKGLCGITQIPPNTFYAVGRYSGPALAIKSTDKGVTWIDLHIDSSLVTRLVDTYFSDTLHGFVVGNKGGTTSDNGKAVVLYTTDGGVTWINRFTGTIPGYLCWKTDFRSEQFGYVACENFNGNPPGYLLTNNGGVNWTFYDIPNAMDFDVEGIGFLDQSTGWIGGWGGLNGPTYQTTNGGTNWTVSNFGYNINRFQFINDTLAYAVGKTFYKYSRITGIHQISTLIPVNFLLEQNYPNPFNPSTKIKFSVHQSSEIILKVFDLSGKEIAVLVNENLQPGEYETAFNGENYSSGVYYLKMIAGSYSETKKMTLLK